MVYATTLRMMNPMSDLQQWLESSEYLPDFMRDFHDQKDIFKSIERLYRGDNDENYRVSWIDCHVYTIDRFLWYMASRGYTLQKSRKNVMFKPMLDHHAFAQEELHGMLQSMLNVKE
jgi:hypothetical protein